MQKNPNQFKKLADWRKWNIRALMPNTQLSGEVFQKERGFTLIELMVVLAIMVVMVGLVLLNFGRERSIRNLKIAQNELVTNLRKAQGYALSARTLGNSTSVQFYIVKFDSATPGQYYIEAVYDYFSGSPKKQLVETVMMPKGVTVSPGGGLAITRPFNPSVVNPSCALIAFKVPYGEALMNNGCSFSNFNNDDYSKIVNFITNPTAPNNPTITASENSDFTITVVEQAGNVPPRSVEVRGVSGKIITQ